MLHVQVVKGPPTEVQTFDEDELAHRLTDHDVEVIREIFQTPLTGSYNWDYEAANSKIRRLYELGKRFNWNAELDVDWDQAPPAPANDGAGPEGFADHPKWQALTPEQKRDFGRRSVAQTLSQFLHGEQGALMVASQLVSCAPTHDAKLYAASQTFDEARHVEVFHRYLMERCRMIYPINPNLKFLLDKVLTDPRWDLKFIGMQILIEGLALAAFQTIKETTPDPLLRDVIELVMRDEGRHVAFGVNYLEDWIRSLPEDEIEERAQFAYEACVVMRNRLVSTTVAEEFGFTRDEALAINNASQGGQAFRKFLFERMIPNLKRVGLLTEKIRPKFEELGVLEVENLQHDGAIDWATLEAPLKKRGEMVAAA
jgi:hypothetical protein